MLEEESMISSDSKLLLLKQKKAGTHFAGCGVQMTDLFVAETVTCHVTCHLFQITSISVTLFLFQLFYSGKIVSFSGLHHAKCIRRVYLSSSSVINTE